MVRKVVWPVVLFVSVVVCAVVVVLNSNGWVPVLWEGMVLIDGEPQYPALAYVVFEPAVRPAPVMSLAPSGETSTAKETTVAHADP